MNELRHTLGLCRFSPTESDTSSLYIRAENSCNSKSLWSLKFLVIDNKWQIKVVKTLLGRNVASVRREIDYVSVSGHSFDHSSQQETFARLQNEQVAMCSYVRISEYLRNGVHSHVSSKRVFKSNKSAFDFLLIKNSFTIFFFWHFLKCSNRTRS